MILEKLKMVNFEGIKNFELDTEGRSAGIYGDNGTGKTTVADAYAYLLFGTDSRQSPNFTPKPRDSQGDEIHGLSTETEGTFRLDNGTRVTLKKVFAENWKKKRGSTEAVFSGHTVSYYIDGAPKKEKEYLEFLCSIAELKTLMLLSVPTYFTEILDVRKRREMLMDLAGDIDDTEVIESFGELRELLQLTLKPGSESERYTMEEFVKISRSGAAKAQKDLEDIPGRIDEQTRSLSEVTEEELEKTRTAAQSAQEQKKMLLAGTDQADSALLSGIRAQIAQRVTELEELRAAHLRKNSSQNESISKQIDDLTSERYVLAEELSAARQRLYSLRTELGRLRESRSELYMQYQEVSASQWAGDTVCPACRRPIPEEQLIAVRAEFNEHKSRRLTQINEKGRSTCSKEMIEAKELETAEAQEAVEKLEHRMQEKLDRSEELRNALKVPEPFELTEDSRELRKILDELREREKALYSDAAQRERELSRRAEELDVQVAAYTRLSALAAADERAKARIVQLKDLEKQYARAYAQYRKNLDLAELFTRRKAELMTERINANFQDVRFRLFRVQINGGITDDCEVLALTGSGHIPYSTANNAAKINAQLSVISSFGRILGLRMPVFADNAESVTVLDKKDLQVIRLVVSEKDKSLRTETEE